MKQTTCKSSAQTRTLTEKIIFTVIQHHNAFISNKSSLAHHTRIFQQTLDINIKSYYYYWVLKRFSIWLRFKRQEMDDDKTLFVADCCLKVTVKMFAESDIPLCDWDCNRSFFVSSMECCNTFCQMKIFENEILRKKIGSS